MFPAPLAPPRSPAASRRRAGLRARLVRGLDLAVEFATLGEYGVEEVAPDAAPAESAGWEWPPRGATFGNCGRPRCRGAGVQGRPAAGRRPICCS